MATFKWRYQQQQDNLPAVSARQNPSRAANTFVMRKNLADTSSPTVPKVHENR